MPISVTRTYLELPTPDDLDRSGVEAPGKAQVSRCFPVLAARFRMLYDRVGSTYGWHDRDPWADSDIESRYAGDRVNIWELEIAGELAGFYELERHPDGSIEIVLFGLLPSFAGRGVGKWLLVNAADRAWQLGASRVWLHTCTLDSPQALPNYLARGFRPFRSEHYQVE